MKTALIYGFGYVGRAFARQLLADGWSACAITRSQEGQAAAGIAGVSALDLLDTDAIAAAVARASAILVTAAPDDGGCPGFASLHGALSEAPQLPRWIGYLSSTSVYGDRAGQWTDEDCPLAARSPQGLRRAAAERTWLELNVPPTCITVFRLSGIYGPGRSPFDRLRRGTARRLARPGHITSRIHVDDIVSALRASLSRPRGGAIYNLSDDEPASSAEVMRYAAHLLAVPPPPLEPFTAATNIPPAARRFHEESRRISNSLARRELGWMPAHPSYREGLAAILAAGG